ncbi:hypothetical protein C8F04DRAFT_1270165 [Mycena alexandri]|uniref:Uncharacterized protein n=1 Tax=Mycena alexandri TaxID=1745969 RepID=A0AAD6SB53_9AGAR|nr:hypothetical protein C8F04DRAFT_1270165 [Mycena alexandri]
MPIDNQGLPPGYTPAPLPKGYHPHPHETVHQIPAILPRRRRPRPYRAPVTRPLPPPRPTQYQLVHSSHPPIHPARVPPVDEDAVLLARFAERNKRERAEAVQGGPSKRQKTTQ